MIEIKKILKFIWDEFIYGGHLLSLGGTSVTFFSCILLNIKITLDCLFIVYLIVYVVYLYNRFKEIDIDCLTLEFTEFRFNKHQVNVEIIPVSKNNLYPKLPVHNICIATEVMEHLIQPLKAYQNIKNSLRLALKG